MNADEAREWNLKISRGHVPTEAEMREHNTEEVYKSSLTYCKMREKEKDACWWKPTKRIRGLAFKLDKAYLDHVYNEWAANGAITDAMRGGKVGGCEAKWMLKDALPPRSGAEEARHIGYSELVAQGHHIVEEWYDLATSGANGMDETSRMTSADYEQWSLARKHDMNYIAATPTKKGRIMDIFGKKRIAELEATNGYRLKRLESMCKTADYRSTEHTKQVAALIAERDKAIEDLATLALQISKDKQEAEMAPIKALLPLGKEVTHCGVKMVVVGYGASDEYACVKFHHINPNTPSGENHFDRQHYTTDICRAIIAENGLDKEGKQ